MINSDNISRFLLFIICLLLVAGCKLSKSDSNNQSLEKNSVKLEIRSEENEILPSYVQTH